MRRRYPLALFGALLFACIDLKGDERNDQGDASHDASSSDALWPFDGASLSDGGSTPSIGGIPDRREAAEFVVEDDGVILDARTGLRWQEQISGTYVEFAPAKSFCAARTNQGASDWRLPSRRELLSILTFENDVVAGSTSPPFPRESRGQWTAEEDLRVAPDRPIWIIEPSSPPKLHSVRKIDLAVPRCVRGPKLEGALLVSGPGPGTLKDARTGLLWEAVRASDPMTAAEAYDHCSKRVVDGAAGFRLPTFKELYSILDDAGGKPYLASSFPEPRSGEIRSKTLADADNSVFVGLDFDAAELRINSGVKQPFTRCVR